MSGEERREKIISTLKSSAEPVSGTGLAKELGVSRQVIVQDIALLRAKNYDIYSTNKGYGLREKDEHERIFKIYNRPEEVEKELQLFVDQGGFVKDVFVYHKVYNVVKAELNIASRADIEAYMEDIRSGKSTLLNNLTSGYHYHTIIAKNEKILDKIQEKLTECGFLAQLLDYEPVDFWKNAAPKEDNP